MARHFGIVVYDEIHHLGAPNFSLTAAIGHGQRWGLSATPSRSDGTDQLIQYHVGPVIQYDHVQELIPTTWFVRIPQTAPGAKSIPNLVDRFGEYNLAKIVTWLSEHEERNKIILNYIDQLVHDGRKILVLGQRVEHLIYLHEQYVEHLHEKVGLIHGEIKGATRHSTLKSCDLIFATQVLAQEALDRKDLDAIVLITPFSDDGILRQVLGRIQRVVEGKKDPVMLVFEDINIKMLHNLCNKMRFALTNMKYPFEVTNAT
jgi:superfamily II DNA or RNA helicase